MISRVRVLCRPATAAGFHLAGLAVHIVATGADLGRAFGSLQHERGLGLLLVEDSLHAEAPDDVRAALDRSAMPMVLPFPGPRWVRLAAAEERVVELLRRAIGYRVRLQ